MPELPEVEAARRSVEDHCVGKKIKKAVVADDQKVVDGVSAKDFEAALVGKSIVGVHRKGKNMWIQLDSPPHPSFQFGMSGAVYIKGVAVTKYKRSAVKDTDEWPSKYSKLFVELDDGLEFSFTDKRRFAKVRLLENPLSVPPISELGPDALMEPMTIDNFFTCLIKKKIGIKALLLDQHFISGIGNWMADEVLYQARIHPLQIASSMPKESCATLLKCINEVIEKAIEVGSDSSQFPSNWIFHSREKKPGKAFVDGKKIEFINAGGRTTAYVPQLQKLVGDHVVKDTSKQSKGTNSGSDADDSDKHNPRELEVLEGRKSGRAKKSSSKSKLNASAEGSDKDEGDSDADYASPKRLKRVKKPPAKRKTKESTENEEGKRRAHKESDDELDNPSGSDDQEEDRETEITNEKRARAVASSRKKVASRRSSKARNSAAKL